MQKRTILKDSNPGCFDLSLGGVFGPDESPLLNATRELKEELNLPTEGDQFTFTFAGSFPYQDPWTSNFAYPYVMRVYDEDVLDQIKLQETEVEAIEWWSIAKVEFEMKM